MNLNEQIEQYIAGLPEPKRSDMALLHQLMLQLLPGRQLWFLDGKNSENKIVSNPNIGYGAQIIQYADGSSRPFYQIGISANTMGISIYFPAIKDKTLLNREFGTRIGKATISGYCIKFRKLKTVDMEVLKEAVRVGTAL